MIAKWWISDWLWIAAGKINESDIGTCSFKPVLRDLNQATLKWRAVNAWVFNRDIYSQAKTTLGDNIDCIVFCDSSCHRKAL